MKRAIIAMVAIFLLTGCTQEVKESKQESKQAITKTENIQKSQTVLSEDEKAYMEIVNKALQEFVDSATDISSLMKEADKNHAIANSEEWINELRGSFISIAMMGGILREMDNNNDTPERFDNLYDNLQASFDLMVEGGYGLIEAIEDNLNADLFNESMQTMALSNQKMIEVNEELNQINLR